MKWFTLAVVLLVLAGCGGGGDKAEKPQGYVSRAERAGAAILGAFHSLETRRERLRQAFASRSCAQTTGRSPAEASAPSL
jgi:hypothetical protein